MTSLILENWQINTISPVNMKDMFIVATNFNQPIGNWNVSNVTDMESMFRLATNFNQNIGNWNVENVTNFLQFFNTKTSANYSSTNNYKFYSCINHAHKKERLYRCCMSILL